MQFSSRLTDRATTFLLAQHPSQYCFQTASATNTTTHTSISVSIYASSLLLTAFNLSRTKPILSYASTTPSSRLTLGLTYRLHHEIPSYDLGHKHQTTLDVQPCIIDTMHGPPAFHLLAYQDR